MHMYKKYGLILIILIVLLASSCNYTSDMESLGIDGLFIDRPTFSPSSGEIFEKSLSVNINHKDSKADIFYWRETEVPKFIDFFKETYSLFENNKPDSCENAFKVINDAKLDPDYFIGNALLEVANFNECQSIVRGIEDAPQLKDYVITENNIQMENFEYCVSVLDDFANMVEPSSEKIKELSISLDSELLNNCLTFLDNLNDEVSKEFTSHEYKNAITIYDSEILLALAYKDGLWSEGFSSAIYKREGSTKEEYSESFMEFTEPKNNQYFDLNEKITFNAISTANEDIDRVEFYKDGELFKFDSVAPYSFDWASNISGSFLFEAKGYLVDGSSGSAFVHVRVDTDIYVDLSAETWSVEDKNSFNLVCESMDDADLVLKIDNSIVKSGKKRIEYASKKPVGAYDVLCTAKKDGVEISDTKELVIYSINEEKDKGIILVSDFDFSHNLSNLTREELLNITNFSIQNEFVKVLYLESLKIQRDLSLPGNIVLSKRSVFINSETLFEFDKKAHITFYDVDYSAPIVIKDRILCSAVECFNRRYDRENNIYEMDVLGFSNYTIYNNTNPSSSRKALVLIEEEEGICVPNWQCMTLSECEDGYIDLSCFDTNKCDVSIDRPEPRVTCEEAKIIMEKQTVENPAAINEPDEELVINNVDVNKEIPDKLEGDEEGSSNLMLFIGIGVLIIIILVVLFFFVFKKEGTVTVGKDFKIKPEFEKKCFEYLDRMRGLGYEDDFIKQKMEASGYTQELVEYLFRKYK